MKNGKSEKSNIEKGPDQETKVVVKFPDEISIDLVQSNELKHYELFQWLVALLLPIAVGFWTAYFTLPNKNQALFWSGLVFSVIAIIFIYFAFLYRKKVYRGTVKKEIYLKEFNNK